MKKINILYAIALSCALVFSATACTNEATPSAAADGGSEATTTTPETSADEPEATTAEPEADAPVKDYTSAPYYENLEAWFDRWGYTEEQREAFLKDTETCDQILYDGKFWATDDLTPVIMPNGYIAANDNVAKIDDRDGGIQYFYTLDLCLSVPYGTTGKERVGDNWTVLEAGSEWKDFTVSEASSGYNIEDYKPKSRISFQEAHFAGSITVTATAEYLSEDRGITDVIALRADEASRSVLPSLLPYFEYYADEDSHYYSGEAIYFTINSENEYFQQIADKLDAGEDFTVTVTADAFMLQWTDYGLVTDGITNGKFENILDFNIN